MKPFKTLDEQIAILLERGLTIDNVDTCRQYLLTNNYYNTVNGYGKFFHDNKDCFIPKSNFRELSAVHLYDKEIKTALLSAIVDAERHFKSVLAYRYSEVYPEKYSYLNINNFKTNNDARRLSQVTNLTNILARLVNKLTQDRHNNAIKHHYNQHNNVPFWVIVNELTLGQTFNFYRNLNEELKNQIARDLSSFLQANIQYIHGVDSNKILSGQLLENIFMNILEVRNVTAHDNKLFGYKCRNNLPVLPQAEYYDFERDVQRQSVFYVFISLQCLLSNMQYAQLHNTLIKRTKALNNKLKVIDANVILETLGFPEDWFIKCRKLK